MKKATPEIQWRDITPDSMPAMFITEHDLRQLGMTLHVSGSAGNREIAITADGPELTGERYNAAHSHAEHLFDTLDSYGGKAEREALINFAIKIDMFGRIQQLLRKHM